MSDYLFARPNFWSGFSSVFDPYGGQVRINFAKTPEEADLNSLIADWLAVYADLKATPKPNYEQIINE